MQRRKFLKTTAISGAAAALGSFCSGNQAGTSDPLNVLFLAVDDLRPQLSCYGHRMMISPNIDRLAKQGTLFERCYCQVPVCGASRASLLTGVRPTRDRFVTYHTQADQDLPEAITLPEYFKKNGYYTLSNGKVFHDVGDSPESWSEPAWRPNSRAGEDWRNYITEENRKISVAHPRGAGPAFEIADAGDDAYYDGQFLQKSRRDLRRLKDQQQPFFLAVGFLKPHLPFNAPRKYWDLYSRSEIDLADNPFRPKGAPDAALHNWGELRAYVGIPQEGPLDDELARTLIHGYYACVSYTDALVGGLLDELEILGLKDNTVVVLWGDHGWNLGEHGLWCKHCNFETSLHSPLIISAPGKNGGQRTSALTEFVDIYPTLCELCNLPGSDHLEGLSLVPLIEDPGTSWKKAAFSRFKNGDSVRTDRYRYTEWLDNPGTQYARMLYDHETDPGENSNISEHPGSATIVRELSSLIREGWEAALPNG